MNEDITKNLYSAPVDNLFRIFTENFVLVLNKHPSLKEPSRTEMKFRNKPWLTKRIRISIKTKNTLYKKWNKRTSTKSFQRYKMYRKNLTHLKEKSKELYYNNLFETNKANARKVLQGINDLLRRKK